MARVWLAAHGATEPLRDNDEERKVRSWECTLEGILGPLSLLLSFSFLASMR